MSRDVRDAYAQFLARKAQLVNAGGFEPVGLPGHLFDFQRALVEWAVKRGRAGIFADCGLGKTPMALSWAEQVHRHTGKPVLLLTPLAVGQQIAGEATKFGHDAGLSRNGKAEASITITNYEQLHRFDWTQFGGVVCDESSILKSFDGSTKAAVTEFMRQIQYRLLCTATAAPNGDQKTNRYSHWIWRRYASSVWDDVRLGRVLPFREARGEDDEKHVHPLQLDVIERFIDLRTKPGERVLTPFMGVGSEVYTAVKMGRFGIGAELKPSYYRQAVANLATVDEPAPPAEVPLFDLEDAL